MWTTIILSLFAAGTISTIGYITIKESERNPFNNFENYDDANYYACLIRFSALISQKQIPNQNLFRKVLRKKLSKIFKNKDEKHRVKSFLIKTFKKKQSTNKLLNIYKDIKPKYRIKLLYDLMQLLFQSENYNEKTINQLDKLSTQFKIPKKTFNKIKDYFNVFEDFENDVENEQNQMSEINHTKNYYIQSALTILELDESASKSNIKKAYYRLAKKYHPDTQINLSEKQIFISLEKFKEIKTAYEFLMKITD